MENRDAAIQEALKLFDSGYTCSEAAFLVGLKVFGIDSPGTARMATGFGGGVSRTQSLCGAIGGAVMALGAAHGRDELSDDRTRIVNEVQALMNGFRQQFGSENCFTLTGLDFNTPEGMVTYRERVHGECRKYVAHVVSALFDNAAAGGAAKAPA